MKKGIVAFCGHREELYFNYESITREALTTKLECEVLKLFEEYDYITFFVGTQGAFDNLVHTVLNKISVLNDLPCEIVVVLAYLKYDDDFINNKNQKTIFPPLEKVPKRYAISRRNRWMVDEADVVIAFVWDRTGGSGKTLDYAERKQRTKGKPKIINLAF